MYCVYLRVSNHTFKTKKMENPLENLIGLYCMKAYCGYWEQCKIICLESLDTSPLLSNHPIESKWLFETGLMGWRLLENGTILTGASESKQHKDNYLKSLNGKKIVEIKKNNATDYSLIFQDNFKIDTFIQGIDPSSLEFYNAVEESHLVLDPQGNWNPLKETEGYSDAEKLQDLHSKQTDKRWEKIVPRESYDNHCSNCAYFITIEGRSYLWDYGICSNKDSYYDGQVVGVRSTCEYFDFELTDEQ